MLNFGEVGGALQGICTVLEEEDTTPLFQGEGSSPSALWALSLILQCCGRATEVQHPIPDEITTWFKTLPLGALNQVLSDVEKTLPILGPEVLDYSEESLDLFESNRAAAGHIQQGARLVFLAQAKEESAAFAALASKIEVFDSLITP
jgi:hypothetical protein